MGASISMTITQNNQSVASNTSNVTVAVTVEWSGGTYNHIGCWLGVTIDGKDYGATVKINPSKSNSGSQVVYTNTLAVSHNSDGTKTLVCSAYLETGTSSGTVETSVQKTLTTIARSSVPTVSASSTDMGSKVQIQTNRKNTGLLHDLAYSFAGGSYVTFATGVGDSYVWTVPDLASSVPNATSGTVTIRCTTKSGSTEVGTATVTMTLKVPTSVVPTISKVAISEATEGLAAWFGFYVQHKSTLDVVITAAGAKGSTISSYKTVVSGVVYDYDEFTTNELSASGTQNVVVTVTDSRGRTASKTVSIDVQPYEPPKIPEFKVFRCDAAGNPADDGVHVFVSTTYSVSNLKNSNTALATLEYKRATDADWTYLDGGESYLENTVNFVTDKTFSVDYQYSFRFTMTDWFGTSTSYVVMLSSADVVLDISSDGTGLGIGKVAQRSNATEFARVMYDRFDKRITNGLAIYTGSSYDAVDPNTTLEHIVLTDLNTPTEAFYYVCTYFYSDKTDASNKAQMAVPYNDSSDNLYYRYKYAGKWSAWQKPNDPLSAYPVNSIYLSYSHTSPAELFGGTWTRISGAYLWAAGESETIGSRGGTFEYYLKESQLPSHTHGFQYTTNGGSSYSSALAGRDGRFEGGNYLGFSGSVDEFANYQVRVGPAGSGEAISIVPPWVLVSVWRRIE